MSFAPFHSVPPQVLPVRTVLGLPHAGADDWAGLLGMQYGRLVAAARLKIASHAIAAMACIWLFRDILAIPAIAPWALMLGVALALSVRDDLAMHEVWCGKHDSGQFRRQIDTTALLALAWVAPVIIFAGHAPPVARLELWAVLALLMTVSALVIPAAPMATLVFTAVVGVAGILAFLFTDSPSMAGVAALFVATIMLASIETSRNLLASRLGAALARHDTLTGLPNRMMLIETASEALRHAGNEQSQCAFLMIDLDLFKAVNDTLGHAIGDQLLASVSDRLASLMSETDLCGRLGGDEFGVVIRDASDPARVDRAAQVIIDCLSKPYRFSGHDIHIGASVGAAVGPRDGDTVPALMRSADLALYRVKHSGGGQYCFYDPALGFDSQAGSAVGGGSGPDQPLGHRGKQGPTVAAAVGRLDHALGVRHHPQHVARLVEHAGDIAR